MPKLGFHKLTNIWVQLYPLVLCVNSSGNARHIDAECLEQEWMQSGDVPQPFPSPFKA
jgi:hypothetical protein